MDKLDGRDIGKINKFGYLKGTKAWTSKFVFIGGCLAFATAFTLTKM